MVNKWKMAIGTRRESKLLHNEKNIKHETICFPELRSAVLLYNSKQTFNTGKTKMVNNKVTSSVIY